MAIGEMLTYSLIYEEQKEVEWDQGQAKKSVAIVCKVWRANDESCTYIEYTLNEALGIGYRDWPTELERAKNWVREFIEEDATASEAVRDAIKAIDQFAERIPKLFSEKKS